MTDMVIPPEAVEAAVAAFDDFEMRAANAVEDQDAHFEDAMRVALAAALPHLRVQETRDAKAEAWEEGWRRGVRDANRTSESWTTENPYRKAADHG